MQEYKIGMTWGCWDLFHVGHLNILKNAKKQCDKLYVMVSTDDFMIKTKGKVPFFCYEDRKKIVSAFKYVDFVDEQSFSFTKKDAIEKYKPDVLFVGSDHINDYTGEGLGVPVIYLKHTDRICSTHIRNKVLNKDL